MGEKRERPAGGGRRPPWKRGKQDTGKLPIGSRGLLITNAVSRKHKEAMQECLTILREHCESVNPAFGRAPGTADPSGGAANVEDAIKQELLDNKRFFDRFVPGPCISKNLNVVHFKDEADVPSTYVREIFHAILNNRAYSARFLCRIVPYDLVCKAEGEPFTEALTALVAREFPDSQANGVCEKEDKGECETWSLSYACRNSNALKRQDVLDLAVQLVGRNYRVDLRTPDRLLVVEVVKGAIDFVIPAEGAWVEHEDEADSGWYTHEGLQWMYNTREGIYFHIESKMVVSSGGEAPSNLVAAPGSGESSEGETEEGSDDDDPDAAGTVPPARGAPSPEDATDGDLSIDFDNDLLAATVCRRGRSDHKEACEDYFVTRECMSIHLVSRSEALCYFTGVFDGHCGYKCAEYLTKHLKNNILSVYRQAVRSLQSKSHQQHFFPIESVEVRALMQGCTKGFEMTDNNFCNVAKQYNLLDGSTATVSLIYGPDVDGCLKLITAHVGDSRAILCSMADSDGCFAQAMTTDHKPNNVKERKIIEKNGGTVEFAQGAWRCVARSRNGEPLCALATSRAIGDYPLKHPNRIVSSEPDVSVYTINFDSDLFLVLVTDGITEVLTNQVGPAPPDHAARLQEIIDIVCEAIDEECTADAAAERVVVTAEQCGSMDDKTCTVIYFGWHKDLFEKCVRDKDEDALREARKMSELVQVKGEKDDDIFSP
ncbi:protein phosphatase 2C domain containing protein [Babesia caballi]|uniref:Protein phosphatase 2C domain containing protein n=1 Tax=Babesia caballi TaxID=5871 RepID=A0AAV4LTB4_BABCB|nr:protein phosphatase 2C domain containing protein [Babesia caballi]